MENVIQCVHDFYWEYKDKIKESHGYQHAMNVYHHSVKALDSLRQQQQQQQQQQETVLDEVTVMEVQLASLLHDVDDTKYFPNNTNYENAKHILSQSNILLNTTDDSGGGGAGGCSMDRILKMISWVSCSQHGNTVPEYVKTSGKYYMLIPRWSDRLEAVGIRGVIRCYQYNREHGHPLFSTIHSPRPQTVEEVWTYATPERFHAYTTSTITTGSTDMISHYYDKLLHIAQPPKHIVQNTYLESMAEHSCQPLLDICIRYGQTGTVDETYIQSLSPSS